MRLRRNCTKNEFLAQADEIGHRFIDKAYNSDRIEAKIQEVKKMDRTKLIKDKQTGFQNQCSTNRSRL